LFSSKGFLCHSITSDFQANFYESFGEETLNEQRLLANIFWLSESLGQVTTPPKKTKNMGKNGYY